MSIHSVSSGNVQKNAAGQAPRTASGKQNTTSTTEVGEKQATRVAAPDAPPTQALNPRLAAFARNVDTRLKHAIENSANDPRQQDALKSAQANFHSMVLRLDDAFLTEGKPKLDMSPNTAMNRLMDHLTGAVQTALTHGQVDLRG